MIRILVVISIFIFSSCVYDNEEDLLGTTLDCESLPSSFTVNVQPLIQQNCAISGCHVPGGQQPDFSSYATIKQNAFGIQNRTGNRTMPPPITGRSLSDEDIRTISCWVDGGALEN